MALQSQPSYFSQFQGFSYDPHNLLQGEFERLAESRGWIRDSHRWRREWRIVAAAEFEIHFGHLDRGNKLEGFRELLRELGVTEVPTSIAKCKAVCTATVQYVFFPVY